jgi:hypothetical protein
MRLLWLFVLFQVALHEHLQQHAFSTATAQDTLARFVHLAPADMSSNTLAVMTGWQSPGTPLIQLTTTAQVGALPSSWPDQTRPDQLAPHTAHQLAVIALHAVSQRMLGAQQCAHPVLYMPQSAVWLHVAGHQVAAKAVLQLGPAC